MLLQPKDKMGHLCKISWKNIVIRTMLVTLLPLLVFGKTKVLSQTQEKELGRYIHQGNDFRAPDFGLSQLKDDYLQLLQNSASPSSRGRLLYIHPVGRRLSSRFVTINSTFIKPSMKVRNLTFVHHIILSASSVHRQCIISAP